MAGKNNDIFQRIEKKYLMDRETYEAFYARIGEYMKVDEYGLNTICNVYYDTPQFDLIRTSIEKPVYKEKLRIRSYGVPGPESPTYVEIKKKYKGVVYKRRIQLTLDETEKYLNRGIKPEKNTQIRKEIDYFLKLYHPIPKMYIAYDRIAMYGIEDPSLRLTLDFNIRTRDHDLTLGAGDQGELLLAPGQVLMEIKVGGAYPLWLVRLLDELKIYPTSFSKYGTIYKRVEAARQEKEGLTITGRTGAEGVTGRIDSWDKRRIKLA